MSENQPSEASTRTSSKARLLESIQLAAVAESSAIGVVVRIFEISGEKQTYEELWQSANALEKMITLIQTTEAYKVAAQVRNEKKTDKL